MPFPVTSVLDNFNRSAVGPPPSASWTTGLGRSWGFKVNASNQMVAEATTGNEEYAQYYNVATYGPNCEVYITLAAVDSNANAGFALLLRLGGTLSTSAWSG